MIAILWTKELALISILSMASLVDAYTEYVPWIYINLMILAGVVLRLLQGTLLEWDCLLGITPGIVCLLYSALSKGAIGRGDGWILLAMGLLLSMQEVLAAGVIAFVLANFVMRILLRREHIAFLPFLMAGFIVIRGYELWI